MTKVYVSATFEDLKECRSAVHGALRRLRIEDLAMEAYVAEAVPPLRRCLADVAQCDIYIGIFAWRYGYVPPGETCSITELEYREARRLGKPCLIFVLDENAPWPRTQIDSGENAAQIERLRTGLAEHHVCSTFSSPEHLAALVTAAVANWIIDSDRRTPSLEPIGEEVLKRYFSRLRQQYSGLDLDTLTPPQREEFLQIRLASVFVEQYVREDPPPVELPREWWEHLADWSQLEPDDLPDGIDPEELARLRDSYQARPLQRLFQVIASPDHPAIVLLGDPGAGKSTVARYLALALAGAHVDDRLAPLAGQLPLAIELRSYIALEAEGKCANFLDYLDHRASTDGLGLEREALRRYLSMGRPAVAVFDGLDEVLDRRRREETAHRIAGFLAQYPQIRAVVTSRIVGYSRRILADAGFVHFTLQDLDDDQIGEFLTGWYAMAAADRPERAQEIRVRLHEAVRSTPALRELGGNPLLLTILAIIGRHGSLPRDRWKLYDHASAVLVDQWDVNRHLREHQERPEYIDAEDKKELLRRVAYRMQSAERVSSVNFIDRENLSQVFEKYLNERYLIEPTAARATALVMIDQLRERNFILSRYGLHLYGFVHRTFLEFFCAQAIVAKFKHDQEWSLDRLKDLFRRHWAEPSWREVLRLLAGNLHERHAAELIDLLVNEVNTGWPPGRFPEPPWNLALAAQCLAEVQTMRSEVVGPAESLLRKLILLLEHCALPDDPDTVLLIDEEILPALRAVGVHWPGRDAYLSWYRRRGVRVVCSGAMAAAARLAATLSGPSDGIEDLFDEVLASIPDNRASYAAVAGLVEVVSAAGTAGRPMLASRAWQLLVRRAREDPYAGARLGAVHALGERGSASPEVCGILVERARTDASARIRLAAVAALGERHRGNPGTRELLIDRARWDDNPTVRRAATRTIATCFGTDDELRGALEERLCDEDAEVLGIAGWALAERFGAEHRVRGPLSRRARDDRDGAVRRTAVRLLARYSLADPAVAALLRERLQNDPDAGTVREAARGLCAGLSPTDRSTVSDILVARALDDPTDSVRLAAMHALLERIGDDPAVRSAAMAQAQGDRDAAVRLQAATALAGCTAEDLGVRLVLAELARGDDDATVRLAALDALGDWVWSSGDIRAVFAGVARDDSEPRVRAAATAVFATRYPVDAEVRRLIAERCSQDPHPSVRLEATGVVARHAAGDADSRAVMIDRVRHEPSGPVFSRAAAAVIDTLGPADESRALLIQRSGPDNNAQVRLAAVQLLVARHGDHPDTLRLLDGLIQHDLDVDVFRLAAATLTRRPAAAAAQRGVLVRRADCDDPDVRRAALGVLAERFPDAAMLELLIHHASDDREVRVRREVLGTICEQFANQPAARALLMDSVHDADWSVREVAIRALGEHFGTDPGTRALIAEWAGQTADPQLSRLAGQALSWLPGVSPDLLPDIAG